MTDDLEVFRLYLQAKQLLNDLFPVGGENFEQWLEEIQTEYEMGDTLSLNVDIDMLIKALATSD